MALYPPSELDAVKGGGGEDGVSSELVQGILDLLLDQVIAVAIPPRLPAFFVIGRGFVTSIGTYSGVPRGDAQDARASPLPPLCIPPPGYVHPPPSPA